MHHVSGTEFDIVTLICVHSITKISKMLELARKKKMVQSGRMNLQQKVIRLQRYVANEG